MSSHPHNLPPALSPQAAGRGQAPTDHDKAILARATNASFPQQRPLGPPPSLLFYIFAKNQKNPLYFRRILSFLLDFLLFSCVYSFSFPACISPTHKKRDGQMIPVSPGIYKPFTVILLFAVSGLSSRKGKHLSGHLSQPSGLRLPPFRFPEPVSRTRASTNATGSFWQLAFGLSQATRIRKYFMVKLCASGCLHPITVGFVKNIFTGNALLLQHPPSIFHHFRW